MCFEDSLAGVDAGDALQKRQLPGHPNVSRGSDGWADTLVGPYHIRLAPCHENGVRGQGGGGGVE